MKRERSEKDANSRPREIKMSRVYPGTNTPSREYVLRQEPGNLKNLLRSCHLRFMPRGSKIREENPPQGPIGISHSCSPTCA